MIRDQQRAIERGSFSGNELGTQIRQVADIFVLPDQQRVKLSFGAPALRICNALLPQRGYINSRLIGHLKLSARKTIHPNLRSIGVADITKKLKFPSLKTASDGHPNFRTVQKPG